MPEPPLVQIPAAYARRSRQIAHPLQHEALTFGARLSLSNGFLVKTTAPALQTETEPENSKSTGPDRGRGHSGVRHRFEPSRELARKRCWQCVVIGGSTGPRSLSSTLLYFGWKFFIGPQDFTNMPSTEKCSSDSSGATSRCAKMASMVLRAYPSSVASRSSS